jgi:hypothetical protein
VADQAPSTTATDKLLNVPGRVTLGDRVLTVASLSMREERALWQELAGLVAANSDPFQRIAPVVARLTKESDFVARSVLLELAGREVLADVPPPDSLVEKARRTVPAVLVRELYRRAKKFHPELREEELTAVVTKVNVGDVWFDLEAALGGGTDDPKATR